MKTTLKQLFILIVALSASAAVAQSTSNAVVRSSPAGPAKIEGLYYVGKWVTTNRKLDGTMHCELKQLTADRWQGKFWGVWQEVPFDYTVEFARAQSKPQSHELASKQSSKTVALIDTSAGYNVAGKATIDGAHYDWLGKLTTADFIIRFTGSRYEGHVELKRVQEKAQIAASPAKSSKL